MIGKFRKEVFCLNGKINGKSKRKMRARFVLANTATQGFVVRVSSQAKAIRQQTESQNNAIGSFWFCRLGIDSIFSFFRFEIAKAKTLRPIPHSDPPDVFSRCLSSCFIAAIQ
jgi:hypothetical protein